MNIGMERELRPYQREAISRTLKSLSQRDIVCLQMTPGSGKTAVIAALAFEYVPKRKVLIIADRAIIARQIYYYFLENYGERVSLAIDGDVDNSGWNQEAQIIISTLQRTRSNKIQYEQVGLIVLDDVRLLKSKDSFKHIKFLEQHGSKSKQIHKGAGGV
jgi:superfamily II DNA or RNA helicase